MNGFVYDDVWIVEQREAVHQLSDLGELVSEPFWPEERGAALWRPVTLFGFAVQWVVGGGSPALFHAVNILLYGVVAGLVALLSTVLFSPAVGVLAGLLFAVHPVHVEVTANVVGQAELWAALGYLAALLAAWERCQLLESRGRGQGRGRVWLLAAAVAAVALGVGAKEHVVTFPGALLLIWWWHAKRTRVAWRDVVRREWVVGAATIAVLGAYLVFRARFTVGMTASGGIATGLDPSSAVARTVVMLPISLRWLQLLFLPVWLSADYSPQHLTPDPVFGPIHAAAALLWIALGALVWMRRHQWPAVVVGAALFAITISVVSNVVVPLEMVLAERLLLLPSVGWAIAVAGVLAAVANAPGSSRRLGMILVGIAVAGMAGRSLQRAVSWRSNDTFSAQLLIDAPASFRSHWVLSSLAFGRGDSALGESEMRTAVRLNPDHVPLLEEFGRLYAGTGRYEPSIPFLARAFALDSTLVSSALPLALALGRTGRAGEALVVLDAASRIHGESLQIALVRSEMLQRSGDSVGALAALQPAVQQSPESWRIRAMVAEAGARAGDCRVAIAQADTVLRLAPPAEREAADAWRQTLANVNANCD